VPRLPSRKSRSVDFLPRRKRIPRSIAATLRMALVGARGDTAEELAAALHVHGPEAALDRLRQLDGIGTHEDLIFRALSTMWIQSALTVRKSFLDLPVTVERADFEHQPAGGAAGDQ
jgi:serine protease inhibitor